MSGYTSTRSEVFSLLKYLDATKFVLLGLFTLINTIYSKVWAKPLSKNGTLSIEVLRSETPLLN